MKVQFILYVADQTRSRDFYAALLERGPSLDVPGMTEFELPGCKLGIMPEKGIARILAPHVPHPELGSGIPRCELYLKVDDVEAMHASALQHGATEIEAPAPRDWGDVVGYSADLDGHILAFAQ
jgi:hypothetical protein